MHPFLNVSELSEEEILDKLSKAHTYLHQQSALGHIPTVQSIKDVIETLDEELRQRAEKSHDEEAIRKNPNYLAPIELGSTEQSDEDLFGGDYASIEEAIRKIINGGSKK